MSGTMVIARKELKVLLTSPGYFLMAFLVSLILSYVYPISFELFTQQSQNYIMQAAVPTQQLNVHYAVFLRHLSYLNLLMILIVPAITMKMFSEEKKLRTMDLLMTSPVTSFEIVMGKFLGALGAVSGIAILGLLYPLSTAHLVETQFVPLFISFFGLFLLGMVYISMNLFCSSLTEHSLVSFVMSVVLNISIWFIGLGAEVADNSKTRAVIEHISLNSHLARMVEGTINSAGLIFFFSIISFFLFLTERVIESARWRST